MIFGLTGGIGVGKSTMTKIAREMGMMVWDADKAVHSLYRNDVALNAHLFESFPNAFEKRDRHVNRQLLGDIVFNDAVAMTVLNNIVGERLIADLDIFLAENFFTPEDVLLDIPLLFEYQMDDYCDLIITVHCPVDLQRERVLARGLTPERVQKIMSLQWTNEQRLARSHYAIDTSQPVDVCAAEFRNIIESRPQTLSGALSE